MLQLAITLSRTPLNSLSKAPDTTRPNTPPKTPSSYRPIQSQPSQHQTPTLVPLHVPTPYLAEKVIRHRVSVQTKFFGEQHRRWQMLTLHMSHVDIGKAHVYVTSLSVWCTKKQSYIRTSKRPNKKYIHKQLHANVNRKYIY